MTLRDLVAKQHLGLGVRAVEAGLDRPIRWVYVTDLKDPSPYLQGGELVLTNGLWRRRRADSDGFVARLASKDVCGLAYGRDEVTVDVPPDLIEACERHRLPLLDVRRPVSFTEISQAVAAGYAEERQADLLRAVSRSDALVNALAKGSGARGLLRVLQRDHGLSTALFDDLGNLLATSDSAPSQDERHAVRDAVMEKAALPGFVGLDGDRCGLLFSIRAVGHADAYLLCRTISEPLSPDESTAVEQALGFLGLELARLQAVHAIEKRFSGELLEMIVAGASRLPDMQARLRAFGLDPRGPMAALLVGGTVGGLDGSRVSAELERYLTDHGVAAVVAERPGEAVGILSWAGPEPGLKPLAEDLRSRLSDALREPRLVVGIGGIRAGVEHLRRSLVEAEQVFRFARMRPKGPQVVATSEIGSHSLIFALQDDDVRKAFRERVIGPLVEYDRRRTADLVHTLTVFLGTCGQWKTSADRLHIHVNTLRHRLTRIEELTGRSFSSMADRVDLFIALQALEPSDAESPP